VRKRSRLAAIVIVASSLLIVGPHPQSARPAAARPSRPDVVVIVTDDERARTLRWMPHVWDEIVRRGRRFPNAMVPTSVCCPSRASLLTGLFAHSTKIWRNFDGWQRFKDAGMQQRTVAVWLHDAGYRTALVGKYLNHFTGSTKPPGWQVWHSFVGANGAYYDYHLLNTHGSVTYHGFDDADYSTNVLRYQAVRFIRATPADRPLFLYFAPYAPHGTPTPAPGDVGMRVPLGSFSPPDFNEADVRDKPSWIRSLPLASRSAVDTYRANQYRTLQAVDRAVAAIVQAQRDRSRLDNTLFVVLSDNGDMWGEHRVLGKFVPYDAATRVPLVIRWTKRLGQAGGMDRRLALNLDVPVTVAAAARAATDPVEGHDLLGHRRRRGFVLEASPSKSPGDDGTNVTRPAYCGWRTLRFLFVRYANGRREFYDYAKDPFELTDRHRSQSYAEVRHRLLRRTRTACRPPPPGFRWP
jgi:N-acetylglucosamine-6-sulfatase